MSRGRPHISKRTPFFIGCEGESERSYIKLLSNIANARGLPIHLNAVVLAGGDPLSLVTAAKVGLERKKGRTPSNEYCAKYILLDRDKLGQNGNRDQRCYQLAAEVGFQLIWQDPCHEAVLLRHLAGCGTRRPINTNIAQEQLTQQWPGYQKAMPASSLSNRIDYEALERAAEVEPELGDLLKRIGLL